MKTQCLIAAGLLSFSFFATTHSLQSTIWLQHTALKKDWRGKHTRPYIIHTQRKLSRKRVQQIVRRELGLHAIALTFDEITVHDDGLPTAPWCVTTHEINPQ